VTRREKARTLAADQLPGLPLLPEPGVLRVLMIGDAIGKPGRQALERHLPGLREERGEGNVFNVPMPPGSGDREYLKAFDDEVLPWLEDGAPDVLLVSCGFDAHTRDPLAQQRLTSEAFAHFTKKVARQPVLSLLEGGYDLEALKSSARAHVQALIEA